MAVAMSFGFGIVFAPVLFLVTLAMAYVMIIVDGPYTY